MENWNVLNYPEFFNGNCFVYIQGNEVDIEKYYEIVNLSKEDKLILYPERAMTYVDTICYRPYIKSIITENPWIISCYSRDNVWILRKGEWANPSMQTLGASVDLIIHHILKYESSVAPLIYGGIKAIKEYREIIKNNIDNGI